MDARLCFADHHSRCDNSRKSKGQTCMRVWCFRVKGSPRAGTAEARGAGCAETSDPERSPLAVRSASHRDPALSLELRIDGILMAEAPSGPEKSSIFIFL